MFDAIDNYLFADNPDELTKARRVREAYLMAITGSFLPTPTTRGFWLFAIDATSIARQYAATLDDKTYVYQPNCVAGNKPVTIGHQYEAITYLPHKGPSSPPWVVPMNIRRIASHESETQVGAELVASLFADQALPWVSSNDLVVTVGDGKYGTVPYLSPLRTYPNLVNIMRMRANRVLYHLPEPVDPTKRKRGRPRRYGERFSLKDQATWGEPDEQQELLWTSSGGKSYRVVIQSWDDLIMRFFRYANA